MAEDNPWSDLINQIMNDDNERDTCDELDSNEEFKLGNQNYSLDEEEESKEE